MLKRRRSFFKSKSSGLQTHRRRLFLKALHAKIMSRRKAFATMAMNEAVDTGC